MPPAKSTTSSAAAQKPFFVGLDVGGTNIKIGVVDDAGQTLAYQSLRTEQDKGAEDACVRMAAVVRRLLDENNINANDVVRAGIATPGPMDIAKGMILRPGNLPGWWDFPIRDRMSHHLGVPVTFANDANAAAYGEFWSGAGKQYHSLVLLTLGTGIGGGIVLNGKVWHGADDIAAELGHVSICYAGRRCNCGTIGCVEAYASATAVVKRTQEALRQGARSALAKGGKLDLSKVAKEDKCGHIFLAAKRGDAFARKIVADTIVYLATAMASLVNTFNPDMIVLYGGMTKAGSQLFGPLRKEVAKRCFKVGAHRCKIVPSKLGAHAVIGSALSAMHLLKGNA